MLAYRDAEPLSESRVFESAGLRARLIRDVALAAQTVTPGDVYRRGVSKRGMSVGKRIAPDSRDAHRLSSYRSPLM